MKLGIIGLPNVGKSTLFNCLTNSKIACENYPFCTIEPNIGLVSVPDERLNILAKLNQSAKIIPAVIEFVDIAGLVKGASAGEGLGNKFLSHIREVDALVHVVRCFEKNNITHVEGDLNPVRDIEIINLELILSDLDTIERRLIKTQKNYNSTHDKFIKTELDLLEKIKLNLTKEISIRNISLDLIEQDIIKNLNLLSAKPVLYAANILEEDLINKNKFISKLENHVGNKNIFEICAKLEEDICELDNLEKKAFLKDLNITQTGLDRLIKSSYEKLNLISFFTSGPKETRAWTIEKNTRAPQAAGKIHSDFERGFIKAEVVSCENLIKSKSYVQAKNNGLIKIEGKDYVVKDGDVILFRFNI